MINNDQKIIDDSAIRAADLFIHKISKSYDVAEVIAFGSRARGDNRPDSDFDLAIVLNGGRRDFIDTKLDMAGTAFDVLLETGIFVQALPLWKDDFSYPNKFPNPALIQNISKEGIKLQ